MSAAADIAWSRQLAGTSAAQRTLWTLAGGTALCAHLAAAWIAMREVPTLAADLPPPSAIMLDLAPIATAPSVETENQATDTANSQAVESQPSPEATDTEETSPVETAEAPPIEELPPLEELEPETAPPIEEVQPESAPPVESTEPAEVAPEAPLAEVEPDETETVGAPADIVEPLPEVDPVDAMVAAALAEAEVPLPSARPNPPPPPRADTPRRTRQEAPRRQPAPRRERAEEPRRAAPSRDAARAAARTTQAERAAAPQASSGQARSISPARWQSRLLAHLERRKRYPAAARRQRQEGTAYVRFSIDASGNVGSVSLARSSGIAALDAEVVAMVRRASPVPAPPPGVSRTIMVPVRFNLR